jgi:hypothetical protein
VADLGSVGSVGVDVLITKSDRPRFAGRRLSQVVDGPVPRAGLSVQHGNARVACQQLLDLGRGQPGLGTAVEGQVTEHELVAVKLVRYELGVRK